MMESRQQHQQQQQQQQQSKGSPARLVAAKPSGIHSEPLMSQSQVTHSPTHKHHPPPTAFMTDSLLHKYGGCGCNDNKGVTALQSEVDKPSAASIPPTEHKEKSHLPAIRHPHLPAKIVHSSTSGDKAEENTAATLPPHKSTDADIVEDVTSTSESSESSEAEDMPKAVHHATGGTREERHERAPKQFPAEEKAGRVKKFKKKRAQRLMEQYDTNRYHTQEQAVEQALQGLGIRDARSEHDLLTLWWHSYHPNEKGELNFVSLRDMFADMGIENIDEAIADLGKHFNKHPGRQDFKHFSTWWKDHGHRLFSKHVHGAWWLVNELRQHFNQSSMKTELPVSLSSLSLSLSAVSSGPHGSAPTPHEADKRVNNWWKNIGWSDKDHYSFLDLMNTIALNKHSLLNLWPDLSKPNIPGVGTIWSS